jgi:TRAP-type C4-dicarboxylate transport system substrate-binding protein
MKLNEVIQYVFMSEHLVGSYFVFVEAHVLRRVRFEDEELGQRLAVSTLST